MPELPEVEVIRRGLIPHVVGREITGIRCSGKKLRLKVPEKDLIRFLKGNRISAVSRRGKYLLFYFENKSHMLIHLGMTGKLGIFHGSLPPVLHDHIVFTFHDKMQMRYNDIRRFGFVKVFGPCQSFREDEIFKNLGPEPLGDDFSAIYLKKMAGKRLQPIKNFLMDSRMVAGIGNIYANEILFHAGIDPTTPVGSVSLAMWGKVVSNTGQVLCRAIESGGSTISDFVNSSGQKGYFQLEFVVYGRSGEPCKRCSSPIIKSVIAGRSTFSCPVCQL